MINLAEKKIAHINAEIFVLLDLMQKKIEENVRITISPVKGASDIRPILDLSDKVSDKPIYFSNTEDGFTTEIWQKDGSSTVGLSKSNYTRLTKLTYVLLQETTIKSQISRKFLEKKIFEWLVQAFRTKQVIKEFSSYIIDEILDSIKEYKFRFPLLFIHLKRSFWIGKAEFSFFSEDYMEALKSNFLTKDPETDKSWVDGYVNKYQGQEFVSYTVTAEREKAEEIAFEYCALAVDVLKICNRVIDEPKRVVDFDIDKRLNSNPTYEVISSGEENDVEGFSTSMTNQRDHTNIDDLQWAYMVTVRGLDKFHEFVLLETEEGFELVQLIRNSIKRLANAVSEKSLHQRVVEIFTVFESLLLLNEDVSILDSVCKYCSRLTQKDIDDRKKLIKLLKKMYAVRSNLIHHGKESKFELDELKQLQQTVTL